MDQLNLLQPLSKHSLMSDFECYGGFLPFCLSLDIIELFLNCTSGHRFYQCLNYSQSIHYLALLMFLRLITE